MLNKIFSYDSPYKKRARIFATLWTLLIFIACLIPAKDIPHVDVPLIDKWAHFILFGGFAFLWLCAYPSRKIGFLLFIFGLSIFTGWLVEVLQGALAALGRSEDMTDVLADSVGGLLGVIVFALLSYIAGRNRK